MVMIWIEI